jgi:hypothetical protein
MGNWGEEAKRTERDMARASVEVEIALLRQRFEKEFPNPFTVPGADEEHGYCGEETKEEKEG